MKFFCIGGEDAVRGFRLGGVDGRVVNGAAEAAAALDEAAARSDCGVLIIEKDTAALMRAKVDGIKLERTRPLIVEV